jgi:hypothetical protein
MQARFSCCNAPAFKKMPEVTRPRADYSLHRIGTPAAGCNDGETNRGVG